MALPMEAIELRSNPAARTIATAAVISSPAGARPTPAHRAGHLTCNR
jgi:hypothetical protein